MSLHNISKGAVLTLCVLMLTGCSSFRVIGHIPPSLTSDCGDLPELTGGKSSQVILHLVQVYGKYHECRAKHYALTGIVK